MNISKIKGLKYPNEAFIKYFFNSKFHVSERKKFIEFGSASGNNLALPYQYNHDVIGIDINDTFTKFARENFKLYHSNAKSSFHTQSMMDFIEEQENLNVDVFLLPNVINYLTKEEFINFLRFAKKKNIYKKGASFFLRARTIKDFRFGRGEKVTHNSYKTIENSTNEKGAICTCYQDYELVNILQNELELKDFKVFNLDDQNLQSDIIINNCDVVIWGTIS